MPFTNLKSNFNSFALRVTFPIINSLFKNQFTRSSKDWKMIYFPKKFAWESIYFRALKIFIFLIILVTWTGVSWNGIKLKWLRRISFYHKITNTLDSGLSFCWSHYIFTPLLSIVLKNLHDSAIFCSNFP